MSENQMEDEWSPAYQSGEDAFIAGLPEETNPFSAIAGRIMDRCAWAAGYHDKRREMGQ